MSSLLPEPAPQIVADTQSRIATLQLPKRVFAVGAIHGDSERLAALHEQIACFFTPGDRLVYLGNYLGPAREDTAALDELLRFRTALMARPGVLASDIIYLRGVMEELWHKLLQIQFAHRPADVFDWMERHGIAAPLAAYGSTVAEARVMLRDGPVGLTKWTRKLREAMRTCPGHEPLLHSLRRAAASDNLLFVSSGIDPALPLDAQSDQFWWSSPAFERLTQPYGSYARVVRGFDFYSQGWDERPFALSLDGGSPKDAGRHVRAAMLRSDGQVYERFEA